MRKYSVFAQRLFEGEYGEYVTYGICYSYKNYTVEISDLSIDRDSVEEFCNLLNLHDIEPSSLDELVEDFLAK